MRNALILTILLLIAGCSSEPPPTTLPVVSDEVIAKLSKEIWEKRKPFRGHRLFIWKAPYSNPKTYLLINDSNVINNFDATIKERFSKGYFWGPVEDHYMHLCVNEQKKKEFFIHSDYIKDTILIMSDTRNWGWKVSKKEWRELLSKAVTIPASELKDSCDYYEW